MKYSPSTGCFYPPDIAYGALPSDAVEATDALFADWLAAEPGSTITVAAGALTIVAPAAPSFAQVKGCLIAIATAKREAIAGNGITVDVGTRDAPVSCMVDTSAAGLANLNGLAIAAQTNADATFTWVQSSGNITLTAAQILALQTATASFITSVWVAFGVVSAAIEAGTITSQDAVEAVAWPANS